MAPRHCHQMLASTIVVLLHFTVCSCICRCFFHPLVHVFLVAVLLSVSGLCISFSCGAIVICVWMLCAFVRCVFAICAIVCCSVCMHVVVQCFALVRGVDIVAMFIVRCAFFCPEHVCGCSLSDVCVCVLVALVRPQRLCSEESNAYTKMPFIGVGICAPQRGFPAVSTATCGNMVSVCSCR